MSAPWGAGERTIPPAPGWPGAFWATKKASTHGRTGEASAPTGNRVAHALRRRRKGALALALGEKLRLCPVEGRPDAETAHTPHQRDLRLPRRLPGAAEAVPGGVGAVVGGDRPSTRHPRIEHWLSTSGRSSGWLKVLALHRGLTAVSRLPRLTILQHRPRALGRAQRLDVS